MAHEEQQFRGPGPRISGAHRAASGRGRGGARMFPLSGMGRVLDGERQALARVVSLSDDGLVLSSRIQPHLGDRLTVDVSESCSLTGEVIWVQPGQCGLRLATTIDSAALMRRLSEERAKTRRRRRWWPEKTVVVRSELGLQIVRLRDVSRNGARIVHDGRFVPGMAVKLQLAPGIERPGVLSWSRDGIAGVELTEMLDTDQLGSVKRM